MVVRAGAEVPASWATCPRVDLDEHALDGPLALAALCDRLQRAWVHRERLVLAWAVDDAALAVEETFAGPPWQLGAGFLFPFERLRFLVFSNNYDARGGAPRWWWSLKAAQALGAVPGGPADVTLADGMPAWIDGGPRQSLPPLAAMVISGESVDMGLATPVPAPSLPGDRGLAPDQLDAVAHGVGPSRVVAPAGSGKTRTLAARLRHLVEERMVEPELVTAVAYNVRAAEELRGRLGVGRAMVRTIHSLGWAVLNDARPGLELVGEGEVRDVLGGLVPVPRRVEADPLGPYVEALDEVRAGLRDPEGVEAERDDVPGFASVFEDYRARLYHRGRVDHGEQVYGAIEALVGDPVLRARWQHRHRHLLVDEFQDLTPSYLLLVRLLASPQLQVFGVGDDDQVIYGYAGADPGFLIDFDRYFPGAGEHALEVNYRCPVAVVEASVRLLSCNERRIAKTIRAARHGGANGEEALVVTRAGDADLAGEAACRIEAWLTGGVVPGDIAVLSRVNASLIPVKAALVDLGIPSSDLLDARSLERTTLRALFAWLRIGTQPERITRQDALEAVRRPARGLTTVARDLITRHLDMDALAGLGSRLDGKQAQRWGEFADDLIAVAAAAAGNEAAATVDMIVDDIGLAWSAGNLDSGRTNASRSSHRDDLVAVRRAAALHPLLEDFARWLGDALARPPDPEGVTLSSVHRVKGMEWSRVVVFGADRGTMPHDLSDDVEEERRVFHVAITRAVDQVVVMADESRPSRFLGEMAGVVEPAAVPGASEVGGRRSARVPRRRLDVFVGDQVEVMGGYSGAVVAVNGDRVSVRLETGADLNVAVGEIRSVVTAAPATAAEADPALAEALRRWRREVSAREGVPAYVVFHDTTLEAIAAVRPSTERQLIGVPGIGPAKLERYGDDILALVQEHSRPDT